MTSNNPFLKHGGGGGRRGEAEKGDGTSAFLRALVKGKETSCGLGALSLMET